MTESKDPEFTHGPMVKSIKEHLPKTSNMESESFFPFIPIPFYDVVEKWQNIGQAKGKNHL